MRIALLLYPAAVLGGCWSNVGDWYASTTAKILTRNSSKTLKLRRKGQSISEKVIIKLEPSAVKTLQEMKQRTLELHIISMKTNERRTSLCNPDQGEDVEKKAPIRTPLSRSEVKETMNHTTGKSRSNAESNHGISMLWKSNTLAPAALDSLNLSGRNHPSVPDSSKKIDAKRGDLKKNSESILSNYQLDRVEE